MDLTGLFEKLEIPLTKHEKFHDFLNKNQQEIEDYILKKWNEYRLDEEKTECPESQEPEAGSVETQEEIEDGTGEQTEEALVPEEKEESTAEENNEESAEPAPVQEQENTENKKMENYLKNKHISFPNGKVNQEYTADFDIDEYSSGIAEVTFEGLEEIGLEYDAEKKQIKGIPQKPGDHKITIKYKRKDWEEGKPVFEKEVVILINPDPRSLWNNIATPEDVDYYKPDSDKGYIKVESKKVGGFMGMGKKTMPLKDVVAASQRGRSHAHEGKPRDDDFGMYYDNNSEWYILTVADGAGSAKYSRKGSEIACRTVIEVCKAKLTELSETLEVSIRKFQREESQENRKALGDLLYRIIGTAVFKAYKDIEKEAAEKGSPIRDYSTTLILSICKKIDSEWFTGAFWVGDGGIGIYSKESSYLKVLGEPDGGEFAGQTRFLTMPEIVQSTEIYRRLRFGIVPDFTALILMTDGVTDPKFETDANLNKIEKWHDLWEDLSREVVFEDDNEETANQLLKWLDFWSQGNHDDRTIAILY